VNRTGSELNRFRGRKAKAGSRLLIVMIPGIAFRINPSDRCGAVKLAGSRRSVGLAPITLRGFAVPVRA